MLAKQLKQSDNIPKRLNAYYFRAHSYTIVPHQIREDMAWMADQGTDIVSIAVLEQDLFAAVENIRIICKEADRKGMQVYVVPSRWGGLVAGAPKVPSLFSVQNPDTWVLNAERKPVLSSVSGVISSVNHPATLEFFCQSVEKMLKLWPVKGIIWDEPKTFHTIDHSPAAQQALGEQASADAHLQANIDFFSNINQYIKQLNDNIRTCLFLYANSSDHILNKGAEITNLDDYGCDGRPWHPQDGGQAEASGKYLLEAGERFLKAAHKHNKQALWLIENHNMLDEDVSLMQKRLPEILGKPVEHLIYYYYPRNLQTPELVMKTIAKHITKFKND